MTAAAAASAVAPSPKAIAEAINLTRSDLPGFTASPSSSSSNDPTSARLRRCDAGLVANHPGEVDASSPDFSHSMNLTFEYVSSQVSIERSRSLVTGDLALARSSRVLSCLASALDGDTVASGGHTVHIIDVRASRAPFSLAASDAAFDIRVQFAYDPPGPAFPFYMDIRGFAVGRDELSLMTIASLQPFPPIEAHQLARLMLGRAVARPH